MSIRILIFLSLFSISLKSLAQDQIIYTNNKTKYVDSILCVTNDTLIYSDFKQISKIPIKNIESYYVTIRTEENMKKGYYRRERQYYDLSTSVEDRSAKKERKKDTLILRTHIVKNTIPIIGQGLFECNIAYENFNKKRASLNTNLNIYVINDIDFSLKTSGILFNPDQEINYNVNGYGLFLMFGYRYYIVPFRKFRPGGLYIGMAVQPLYFKADCKTKYYENDVEQYYYKEEVNSIGVNIGGLAGIQWLISSRICLDFELSILGNLSNFSTQQTVYYNNGFELNEIFTRDRVPIFFHINFGYAFN